MSGPADRLLKLMYEWMKKAKECSSNLRDLAKELESLRDDCNTAETVGNTVAVAGSVMSLLAAPFTAGASLFVAGALAGGVGAGVSIGTKITECLMSNSKMKRVKEIDKECQKITNKMQGLFEELREQCPCSSADEKDKHAVKELLKAMSRLSGTHSKDLDDLIRAIIDSVVVKPVNKGLSLVRQLVSEVLDLLSVFCLKPEGRALVAVGAFLIGTSAVKYAAKHAASKLQEKTVSVVVSTGAKQVGKSAAKTAAIKGAKFLGAAVGLALSLPEAIDSWTEAIKNKHETEASKSLRKTAEQIDEAIKSLSDKLSAIQNMLKKSVEIYRREASQREASQRWSTSPSSSAVGLFVLSFIVVLFCCLFFPKTGPNSLNKPSSLTSSDNACNKAWFSFVPLQNHGKQRSSESTSESESEDQAEFEEQVKKIKRSSKDERCHKFKEDCSEGGIQLNMALANTRSANKFITRKEGTLIELNTNNSLHALAFTETWFKQDSPTIDAVNQWIAPSEFKMFNNSRKIGRGGGVAIVVRKDLNPVEISLGPTSTFEHVAVTMTLPSSNEEAAIVVLYRPPGGTLKEFSDNFLNEFNELILNVSKRCKKIIIQGDFNIQFNHPDKDKRVAMFEEIIRAHNLTQHVSQPTRKNNTLDLVLSNVDIGEVSVQDNDFSDHRTVFFKATFNINSNENASKK